jgi:ribosomal protein S18 acetylase RimI-like enzyme
MVSQSDMTLRPASPADAPVLARLMNAAGEGLPAWLWSQMAEPGEDVMAFGSRRVAGDDSSFSYRNVHVGEVGSAIVGMLLGYRLADPYDAGDLDELPLVIRPLIELESMAPGSWYINAVATLPEVRGKGVGSRLMKLAEQLCRESGGGEISLIVARENTGAVRLYDRLGFRPVATRPLIPFPGCDHSGEWVLMIRTLE